MAVGITGIFRSCDQRELLQAIAGCVERPQARPSREVLRCPALGDEGDQGRLGYDMTLRVQGRVGVRVRQPWRNNEPCGQGEQVRLRDLLAVRLIDLGPPGSVTKVSLCQIFESIAVADLVSALDGSLAIFRQRSRRLSAEGAIARKTPGHRGRRSEARQFFLRNLVIGSVGRRRE